MQRDVRATGKYRLVSAVDADGCAVYVVWVLENDRL